MPARPERRPRVEAALKRFETNGILDPPPSRRWVATRPARPEPRSCATGLRKTSVTRELPVGDAGHAPSAFARPSSGRPDNSSLHDVNAGKDAGERSENRSQRQESLPAPHPEFWLLISFWFFSTSAQQSGARPAIFPRSREGSLVEPDGIEPTTSCLQSRRSPN